MQPPDSSFNPYARPLGRGWSIAFAGMALGVALLLVAAMTVERWWPDRRAFKAGLAAMLAPYQELYLASLPGEDGAEYVVFLSEGVVPDDVRRQLAGQSAIRYERDGALAGTVVVTLPGSDGLSLLQRQSYVRFAVRNTGLFFCH